MITFKLIIITLFIKIKPQFILFILKYNMVILMNNEK